MLRVFLILIMVLSFVGEPQAALAQSSDTGSLQSEPPILLAREKKKRRGKGKKKRKSKKRGGSSTTVSAKDTERFYRNAFGQRPDNAAFINQFRGMGMDAGAGFISQSLVTEDDTFSQNADLSTIATGAVFGMPVGPVTVGLGAIYTSSTATISNESDNPNDGSVVETSYDFAATQMQVAPFVGMALSSITFGVGLPYTTYSESFKNNDPEEGVESEDTSGSVSYIQPNFGLFYGLTDGQIGFSYQLSAKEEDEEAGITQAHESILLIHARMYFGEFDLESYLKLLGASIDNDDEAEEPSYKDNQEVGFIAGMGFGTMKILGIFAYETSAAASAETVTVSNLANMQFGAGLRMKLGKATLGFDGVASSGSGSSETADFATSGFLVTANLAMAF